MLLSVGGGDHLGVASELERPSVVSASEPLLPRPMSIHPNLLISHCATMHVDDLLIV